MHIGYSPSMCKQLTDVPGMRMTTACILGCYMFPIIFLYGTCMLHAQYISRELHVLHTIVFFKNKINDEWL